jgi:hypothetical protein
LTVRLNVVSYVRGMKFRIKTNSHTFVADSLSGRLLASFLSYLTPTSNDKLPYKKYI